MQDDPDLTTAYGISDASGMRDLYRRWANSYDTGFAATQGYRLPWAVAQAFVDQGGAGPVLDVGAGTGLVGAALRDMGIGPVDGTDLSDPMLEQARAKQCYQSCFSGDITAMLPVAPGQYRGIVSAGTFTHGHVGPEGLAEVLRIAAPGALIILSINAGHWAAGGFAEAFVRLEGQIANLTLPEVRIYDDRADAAHRNDTCLLACFHRT